MLQSLRDISPNDETSTAVGARLRAARENAAFSPEDLAARLGVAMEDLDAWEAGAADVSARKLTVAAGLLGVSLTWLAAGVGRGVDDAENVEDHELARLVEGLREIQSMHAMLGQKLEGLADSLAQQRDSTDADAAE